MTWMLLPLLACTIIVLTLGWFGLHVLEREVIFVDLALAQVAAMGTTWAVYLGHEPDSSTAFVMGLLFTAIGAATFASTRVFEERVPQEAIIGIAYAVSAASGMLLIHFADDPHGAEKLEHLLVGNLVWVQQADIARLAGACAVVGAFQLLFRDRFLAISHNTAMPGSVAFWDLLFYLSFGLALTSIVAVSGVLLVFAYLVIPAVIARLLVVGVARRLLVGWAVGLGVSVAGVSVSYTHPIGPVIVTFFGILLIATLVGYAIVHAGRPGVAFARVFGAFGSICAVMWAVAQVPGAPEHHGQEELPSTRSVATDPFASGDAAVRDLAAREALATPAGRDALALALARESDDAVRLTMAVVLVRNGDRRGLEGLVALTSSETPFLRIEADDRLRIFAGSGAPAYDALTGEANPWPAWAEHFGELPPASAGVSLP